MPSKIGPLAGQPAVEFELFDTNGECHRLEDDAGHWLWLILHRHLG